MKLRNKKTCEIRDFGRVEIISCDPTNSVYDEHFDSLAELNEEWEDYEEPRDYWYIDSDGKPLYIIRDDRSKFDKNHKEIGNYFAAKEEAEKAVEKLKAITRLNKCGFKFKRYADRDRAKGGDIVIYAHVDIPNNNLLEEAQPAMLKDLDLLFGGEE